MIDRLYNHVELEIADRTITYGEVKALLDKAIEMKLRAVCLPPSFVRWAKRYAGERVKICMYIAAPTGNDTVNSKIVMIREGLRSGADEFEVYVNLNELKSGNVEYTLTELKQLRRACRSKLFKCAIDIGVLTQPELETFCKCAIIAKCDYISIGSPFSGVKNDIGGIAKLLCRKIKIKTLADIPEDNRIQALVDGGAERIGVISLPVAAVSAAPVETNVEKNVSVNAE